jgi:hypothetical protein
MANLIVSAVAKWNGSALKKGQKDLTSFQKTTLALGKAFASAFAVRKITQFGKASVQAFMADEKAAKSLSIALKNTGNGFATIATEGFIARLQQTYRVLDDELRPAFQTLLTATGSITKAQEGLQLALDVSAGTTKDLGSVTAALARGYAGNTQGLSRLGAGLDKAILKTGDMEAITAALTAKFQGQALGALDTYAKKMDALSIAAANSKEIIGKGLLDSIAALGGEDGIDQAAASMESLSQSVADTVYGFTLLISAVEKLARIQDKGKGPLGLLGATAAGALGGFAVGGPGGALVGGALGLTAARATQLTGQYGKTQREKNTPYSATSMYFTPQQAEQGKALFDARKKELNIIKEKNKLTAAELADKKKQAELDALKKKFDVERINLETALANSKDEAEKARLRSLLTIMDEDENAAARRLADLEKTNKDKLTAEYLAAVSLNNLAEAARLAALGIKTITIGGVPIQNFPSQVTDQNGMANELLATAVMIEAEIALKEAEDAVARSIKAAEESEAAVAALAATTGGPVNYGYSAANPSFTYGANSAPVFNISTPYGTEDSITEMIQGALQKLNRYGDSTTFAGAL